MWKKMVFEKTEKKWELIGMVIEEAMNDGPFDIQDAVENDTVFENGLPYCPECGTTEYIFVQGYRCSGSVCVGCGHEELDNDYY
jgi:hypothetical protein